MNQFPKQYGNKNSNILLMTVAFILVSVGTTFGQTTVEYKSDLNSTITANTAETIVVKQEDASTNSNMNFVLWFMGTKQDPNAKILPSGSNTKKQFMTSGSAPNRLLIKAFLKKAVNYESVIV
ncbi:hypothetical protein FNW25_02635 [Flavobacterium franklandianum]|uniref:Uncharacterized protein n=1 Tax=Flavobacterium franklandianum TaxID=2594430 RepID=A0A553CJC0_9FLAO|nr:hypothetical protein [Flavobacterium franklandianum]TRX20591.1 hypothetical protein FNW17_10765 [Flavobacterium franklandianum]TRX29413.1 hypothetical protein FNW25_02635 [Flavobacterium franklandianum]